MRSLWKPMLAAKPDPDDIDAVLAALPYPALFSPKLDGIRATVQNGRLYSRTLKLIPNAAMQKLWGRKELNGLDGELVVGPLTAVDCFNRSTSVVMSRDKPADEATFNVFDTLDEEEPFVIRHGNAGYTIETYPKIMGIQLVPHTLIKNAKALVKYEEKMTGMGHEGVMRRSLQGAYKQGRSTIKEMGLIAVKRTVDAEAVVLDTYEQQENQNEQKVNELGRSKRSSHKAGKVGKGTLGGFEVALFPITGYTPNATDALAMLKMHKKRPKNSVFNIGTGVGLTEERRAELWAKRKALMGKVVKFRYQKIGTVTAPRQPIFLGFRDERDL